MNIRHRSWLSQVADLCIFMTKEKHQNIFLKAGQNQIICMCLWPPHKSESKIESEWTHIHLISVTQRANLSIFSIKAKQLCWRRNHHRNMMCRLLTRPWRWRSPGGSRCLPGNSDGQRSQEPPSLRPSPERRRCRWRHQRPTGGRRMTAGGEKRRRGDHSTRHFSQ